MILNSHNFRHQLKKRIKRNFKKLIKWIDWKILAFNLTKILKIRQFITIKSPKIVNKMIGKILFKWKNNYKIVKNNGNYGQNKIKQYKV
jgi:hypothetical protein